MIYIGDGFSNENCRQATLPVRVFSPVTFLLGTLSHAFSMNVNAQRDVRVREFLSGKYEKTVSRWGFKSADRGVGVPCRIRIRVMESASVSIPPIGHSFLNVCTCLFLPSFLFFFQWRVFPEAGPHGIPPFCPLPIKGQREVKTFWGHEE